MGEENPLVRQWKILQLLAKQKPEEGISVDELSQKFGVSVKTIRRDLKTFQKVGFAIHERTVAANRKLWSMTQSPTEINFNWGEAAALYLGRKLLIPLAGTAFWKDLGNAFRKIRNILGESAEKYLDTFAPLFCQTPFGLHDYSEKSEFIDTLLRAMEESHAVKLTYHALQSTEPVTYDIYPFGLIYHRGSLYLVGRARRRKDITLWKIDRVSDAKILGSTFQRPKDFDLQSHITKTFGVYPGDDPVKVRVRFHSAVSRYVSECCWHPSQRLAQHRNGGVIAEFDLEGLEEIQRWIMSFGKHAEVLDPPELREAILEEWQEALEEQESLQDILI